MANNVDTDARIHITVERGATIALNHLPAVIHERDVDDDLTGDIDLNDGTWNFVVAVDLPSGSDALLAELRRGPLVICGHDDDNCGVVYLYRRRA